MVNVENKKEKRIKYYWYEEINYKWEINMYSKYNY